MPNYTIESNNQLSRIIMEGDLTASIIPELQPRLKQELDRGAHEMVFDLGNTNMLDSSGIGLLIATYNSLNRLAGHIRVINASPNIQQLLQSMRLATRLNVTGRTTS
jgi:anti-anti-sigma factor